MDNWVRCETCRMETSTLDAHHIHVGTLANGEQLYEWRHKELRDCLFSLGLAIENLKASDKRFYTSDEEKK